MPLPLPFAVKYSTLLVPARKKSYFYCETGWHRVAPSAMMGRATARGDTRDGVLLAETPHAGVAGVEVAVAAGSTVCKTAVAVSVTFTATAMLTELAMMGRRAGWWNLQAGPNL